MSEPTYRVEIKPTGTAEFPWSASIYRISDERLVAGKVGETEQEAFRRAQDFVRAVSQQAESEPVFLTEDGEIHDRHEAGVLRDANA